MPLTLNDIVFRYTTNDFDGKDGAGPLTAAEGDNNNFNIAEAVIALQVSMDAVGAGIDTIDPVPPNQFTITLTDSTVQGPFTIPSSTWLDRGEWAAGTSYAVNDIFFESTTAGFYFVKFPHVSVAPFDPGQTDGNANEYYGLALDLSSAASILRQTTTKDEPNTTHTVSALDLGAFWNCSNVSGCEVTIPPDATYNAPVDTEIQFRQATDAPITFVATAPATLDFGIDSAESGRNGAVVGLKKIGTNTWVGWGLLGVVTA